MKTNREKKSSKRADAVELLHHRYVNGRPEMEALLDEARSHAEIARQLYQMRENAGLSQKQLADLVGTAASVICRLEDADYEGHSLTMLERIAAALDQRVEIRFVPAKKRLMPA
jgi:ribosome-binding protein aMBF1 (putative translation factor)